MHSREKEDKFAGVRERMLKWDLKGRDITDPDVLRVMDEIRRELGRGQCDDHPNLDEGTR
jgi:hypothetical protein